MFFLFFLFFVFFCIFFVCFFFFFFFFSFFKWKELLRAASEAAREALFQQLDACVKAVKKGKKKSNTISQ